MKDLQSQICGMNMHYARYSLKTFLEAQNELGIRQIEFWIGAPHLYLDSRVFEEITPIKFLLQQYGISVPVVTTSSSAWQYQYAMGTHRSECYSYFAQGIRAAKALGASIMTVNSGWGYGDADSEAFSRSAEMLHALARFAEQNDIRLAMESLTPFETQIAYDLASTKRLWDQVNHPALEIMVDTVAMAKGGDTLEDWFSTFGKHIIHMHFIDWIDVEDTARHLAWGDGNASPEQLFSICQKYQYSGAFSQEISAGGLYSHDPIAVDRRNYSRLRAAASLAEGQ